MILDLIALVVDDLVAEGAASWFWRLRMTCSQCGTDEHTLARILVVNIDGDTKAFCQCGELVPAAIVAKPANPNCWSAVTELPRATPSAAQRGRFAPRATTTKSPAITARRTSWW